MRVASESAEKKLRRQLLTAAHLPNGGLFEKLPQQNEASVWNWSGNQAAHLRMQQAVKLARTYGLDLPSFTAFLVNAMNAAP